MTDQDHIDRIDALTRNARNTWFTLLAALVFVSVTLMGVEHIDFYGVDRATKLPLVGVDVPTRYFFVAAPILIAAIYGYFHLYLIRLWDALGAAPAQPDGLRLGDAITPWLISDAALHFRYNHRHDECTTPRPLEGGAMLLNLLLSWIFGLAVLGALWWFSMPARTWWMTGIAGLALFISVFAGAASVAAMMHRLRNKDQERYTNLFGTAPAMAALLFLIPAIALLSYQRTNGSMERLARLNLYGENIVEKPAGWLPHDIDRADFLASWCERETVKNCKALGEREAEFTNEWKIRRTAALADMRRPDWAKIRKLKPDFRGAVLFSTFLSGADLFEAQMQEANLIEAQLEEASLIEVQMQGANLIKAQMQGANLSEAQMQEADLSQAQMQGVNLFAAQMQGTTLSAAQMQGANLSGAQMQKAVLSEAQMQGADLYRAQMQGANLFAAQMQGANLNQAQMQGAILYAAQMQRADLSQTQMHGANLSGAQLEGAVLDYAILSGTQDRPFFLQETILSMAINNGGMLRFADLRFAIFDGSTDFRNTFLDGTVKMTENFRHQMGNPCQWVNTPLEEAEFYGRWRGWIESNGSVTWEWLFVPDAYRDIKPIHPPPGCNWKRGPIPDSNTE